MLIVCAHSSGTDIFTSMLLNFKVSEIESHCSLHRRNLQTMQKTYRMCPEQAVRSCSFLRKKKFIPSLLVSSGGHTENIVFHKVFACLVKSWLTRALLSYTASPQDRNPSLPVFQFTSCFALLILLFPPILRSDYPPL